MQTVRKQKPAHNPRRRLMLLIAAAVTLFLIAAAALIISHSDKEAWPDYVSTAENLFAYTPKQVTSITITRGEEPSWTVVQEDGLLVLTGENGFTLSEATSAALLDAASILACEAVLTDDPAEYRSHLVDFGLDAPRFQAVITYSDGVEAALRIGNPGAENNAWYYMTVDGDNRLFSCSRGMVESLFLSRDTLREVISPTIHKARIDRVTLTHADGSRTQWTLQGSITDQDAADRWQLTEPIVYPADANAMSNLLANLANLRLGAYVGPATPENLHTCGFDAPRLIIDIHMAAGTIGITNADGALETTPWPEDSVVFTIGAAKNDMVDYVRFGDDIYVSSHFTMGVFIDYDPTFSMSRYPVLTALGNLASLTIEQDSGTREYVLTRTEQVAANNSLVTDEEGNPIYDITVTCNGEPVDYTAFEAAYSALMMVTVSGTLPAGESANRVPHTVCTFTDVDGTVHTVALATFDVLHDAVIIDEHQAFYLIKGGFDFGLE